MIFGLSKVAFTEPAFFGFCLFVSDELMKPRLTWVLLSCSFIVLAGCTRLTNMMTFNGVSEIPPLTEPDLDDE